VGEGPQAADNSMMRSCCMGVLFTGQHSEDEMGGACGTWEEDEKYRQFSG
jgi:hypothetical protein